MLKVMIVDDDRIVRKCLRKKIPWDEIACTIVAEADDGIEGLQRFSETKPDIIITDLKMPGMGGEDFCEKIREYSDKVSIIFLSAYESFSAAKTSLRHGVVDYILKPIDTEKIKQLTRILDMLSKKKQNSQQFHALIDNGFEKEVFTEQLRKKNAAYFNTFFENMSNYSKQDYEMVKTMSKVMLNILFEVAEEAGDKALPLESKRLQVYAQYNLLSRTMDIVSYTSEVFDEYLLNSGSESEKDFNHIMIEKIKNYVTENIEDPQMSVTTIAEHFDYSYANLGHLFKKYTDVSLVAYITHIRLNHACRLLKNTQFTIAEIAQMVGYSNANYFCSVFKKQLDVTPNEFRNHSKQHNG
ncbi:MAG: response regulator [Lachnospiraceae bacterium]|nr:response regulator [Lachnospiraceae bacterium]MBQ8190124.1 response regulator [Lachnospiraceae bacterium]MBQ8231280.1 response regulator [Lachnospiraceae bacterium]